MGVCGLSEGVGDCWKLFGVGRFENSDDVGEKGSAIVLSISESAGEFSTK